MSKAPPVYHVVVRLEKCLALQSECDSSAKAVVVCQTEPDAVASKIAWENYDLKYTAAINKYEHDPNDMEHWCPEAQACYDKAVKDIERCGTTSTSERPCGLNILCAVTDMFS